MKKIACLLLSVGCCTIPVDGICAQKNETAPTTVSTSVDANTVQWFTGLPAAQKAARERKVPILLLMTGSTWCPPCKYLERNVLSTKEFKQFARKNLVLLKVDLPRGSSGKLSEDALALLKKYPADSVPTIFILNAQGKVLETQQGASRDFNSFVKRFSTLRDKIQ